MIPSVILVQPQIAENIGFCARAMNAFGVQHLWLVDPQCDTGRSSAAYRTASASHAILESARHANTLTEALADIQIALAFSRRPHDFHRPLMTLQEASARQEQWQAQSVALVFGSESDGLQNEHKRLCDAIVSIPLAHDTLSLNLGQAVSVVLYEWMKENHTGDAQTTERITHQEQETILQRAIQLLDATTFFKEGRRERQIDILRSLLQRMNITPEERSSVMGVLSGLEKPLGIGQGKIDRLK